MELDHLEKENLLEALQSVSMETRLNALQTIYEKDIFDYDLIQIVAEIRDKDASLSLQQLAQKILIREAIAEESAQDLASLKEPPFPRPSSVQSNLYDLSERELLVQLVNHQQKQEDVIKELQHRVGCLYTFLVVSLGISAFMLFLEFIFR